MFENPLSFGLLISLIITLCVFYYYKKHKKEELNYQNKQKLCITFIVVFIGSMFIKMNFIESNTKTGGSGDTIIDASTNVQESPPF